MAQLLARDCPRDRTRLVPHEARDGLRALTIDACPRCGGVYLDRGEIARLVPERAVADYFTRILPTTPASACVCPGCGGVTRAKGEDAVSHVCETCAGVWLDAGDLAKLAAFRPEMLPDETREARLARESQKFRKRSERAEPDALPLLFFGGVWGFLYLLLRERRR